MQIDLIDVQVQGEAAPAQIVRAIESLNSLARPPEVLVLTRGGGSADDLAAFSTEPVVRAVAASRIPTLVAIGHEIDTSLAELAADQRASTPSNAAELLVPDRRQVLRAIEADVDQASQAVKRLMLTERQALGAIVEDLSELMTGVLARAKAVLQIETQLLAALNPLAALGKGYAIVRKNNQSVRSVKQVKAGETVNLQFADGSTEATIQS